MFRSALHGVALQMFKANVRLSQVKRNKFYHECNSQFDINFKKCFYKMAKNKRIGHPKLNVILPVLYAYSILESFDS